MRAEFIGHFEPCMNDIYIHIYARMDDYIRTHLQVGDQGDLVIDTRRGPPCSGSGCVGSKAKAGVG